MTVCNICCESLDAKKGDWRSLHGTATSANDVYATMIELFSEMHLHEAIAKFHSYLAEPAFVCKSCFNAVKKYMETKESLIRKLESAFTTFASVSSYL